MNRRVMAILCVVLTALCMVGCSSSDNMKHTDSGSPDGGTSTTVIQPCMEASYPRLNWENLAKKGIIKDLNEYLEADPDISRDDTGYSYILMRYIRALDEGGYTGETEL